MKYTFLLFALAISFVFKNSAVAQSQPVTKSVKMDRPGYSFLYDGDWTIDSTDEDYDIDGYYALDSKSGNGFISFAFFNATIDPEEVVLEQIKAHLSTSMKNGSTTRFDTWGKYKGKGALLKGKLLGIYKGEIRVFCYTEKERSFLIVSQIMDSDKPDDEPGLLLIEKSFILK
ncbi:MAG: hypothetical protein KGZ74_17310 [Chitinophagaceae bacterium]|nr:hypothetical protein [Chitinophagaceae bacterium]